MKRLLFIYNPHAGKELLKPKLSDIIDNVSYTHLDVYKRQNKYWRNEAWLIDWNLKKN